MIGQHRELEAVLLHPCLVREEGIATDGNHVGVELVELRVVVPDVAQLPGADPENANGRKTTSVFAREVGEGSFGARLVDELDVGCGRPGAR